MRLYSICKPTNGVQPRNSASVFALATAQAAMSDTPAWRILPWRTRSSNARITSSIGVILSQMCSQ